MIRSAPLLALPLLLGCPNPPKSGEMNLTDPHNYSFEIDVGLTETTLEEGADVLVEWSKLTTDMRGNAVEAPSDVEFATLSELSLTTAELIDAIEGGSLNQGDIISPWEWSNSKGESEVNLSEFSVSGTYFEPTDAELGFIIRGGSTWTITLWRANVNLGQDEIITTAVLVPDPKSAVTTLSIGDDEATLAFDPDLQTGESPSVVGGQDPSEYVADWSEVATDALGEPFSELTATQLFIAHLPDATSLKEVESTLLSELNTADTWLLDVYGVRSAALAQAASPIDQSYFPGFTSGGIWALGILDPTGQQPSPYFMTIVTVE